MLEIFPRQRLLIIIKNEFSRKMFTAIIYKILRSNLRIIKYIKKELIYCSFILTRYM